MGREQYLKSYKKKGIVFLALGILVELIGVLMLLVAITKMMETTAIVLFALIVIIGAGMSYLGFEFVRGEKCRFKTLNWQMIFWQQRDTRINLLSYRRRQLH